MRFLSEQLGVIFGRLVGSCPVLFLLWNQSAVALTSGDVDLKLLNEVIKKFEERQEACSPCTIRFHSEQGGQRWDGVCFVRDSKSYLMQVVGATEHIVLDGQHYSVSLNPDVERTGRKRPAKPLRPWGGVEPREFLGLRSFDIDMTVSELLRVSEILLCKMIDKRCRIEFKGPNRFVYRYDIDLEDLPLIHEYRHLKEKGGTYARILEKGETNGISFPKRYEVGINDTSAPFRRLYFIDEFLLEAPDLSKKLAERLNDATIVWDNQASEQGIKRPETAASKTSVNPSGDAISASPRAGSSLVPWLMVGGGAAIFVTAVYLRRKAS